VKKIRELVFYRRYFEIFFEQQAEKVKQKIDYVLFLITHAEHVPEKFFKHIEGQKGLYEKTQKTPAKEIMLAVKLMKEYLRSK